VKKQTKALSAKQVQGMFDATDFPDPGTSGRGSKESRGDTHEARLNDALALDAEFGTAEVESKMKAAGEGLGKFADGEVTRLRSAMEHALAPVGTQFGIELKIGTIHYSPTAREFHARLSGTGHVDPAVRDDKERREFTVVGVFESGGLLKPEDWHRELTLNGKQYRIVGWNGRSRKNPVQLERDGRRYHTSAAMLAFALGRPAVGR
jgi:hypothetical protein